VTNTRISAIAAAAIALAASSCTFKVGVRMPEELLQTAVPAGPTAVLPVETQTAAARWEGGAVRRVTDADTGARCIEWYADPATRAEARTVIPHVDMTRYHALRLEWKYMGGGSSLVVQAGKRRWYLFKEKYRPDVWNDMWLDLSLDDDMGGPVLDEEGNLVLALSFGNYALNRTGEQTWRRIRVRNIRLVGFPVLLDCDPRSVAVAADASSVRTTYPLRLRNVSARRLPVELSVDPRAALRFDHAFEAETVVLQPGETRTVALSFSMPAERARDLPPLYFEEVPVYARVPGDPDSLTTWYRGYVQWMTGGIVPPRSAARPFMQRAGTRERILEAARAHPRAKAALDTWIARADAALKRELAIPALRHGYSGNYACSEHQCLLVPDPVNYRHRCPKGNHEVVGNLAADKAVALIVHTRNSEDCAALGWAYYLTGKEAYAGKAAAILSAYAAHYPGWDYADKESLGLWSRVAHAVLGECWWIHGMVEGYDLVAGSPALDAQRRKTIEEGLFLTASEDLQSHRIAANQQCEINDASGGAAINAGNWYLAARVFTGAYGLLDMVSLTFSEEGFSRENEFGYHFAAMYPIVQQGLVYKALGGTFFTPAVKRIFDAPLFQSIDQTMPNRLYETAWARYRDPSYLRSLRALRSGTGPFSREVLI